MNYWSGWAWIEFKKNNPCVDTYYVYEDPGGSTRIGVKSGEAKYIIKAWAAVEEGNGQAVVKHASGWDGNDFTSVKPALIPRLGQIQVSYDLVALKNGETYDRLKNDAICDLSA